MEQKYFYLKDDFTGEYMIYRRDNAHPDGKAFLYWAQNLEEARQDIKLLNDNARITGQAGAR